jgi:hypothetical protein
MVGYGRLLRWNSLDAQAAVTHHPRSCYASAGRDSLRSVGHYTDATAFLALENHLRAELTGFDNRYSHFAVSCPYRIRLASLPSRPSFARRPCLAISVHSSLTDQRPRVRLGAGNFDLGS